jgi:hypothetical protein
MNTPVHIQIIDQTSFEISIIFNELSLSLRMKTRESE